MPLEDSDFLEPLTTDLAIERPTAAPLVSVVVPCCGQLEYTKLCVCSLLRHSRNPFELIFVDMDSLDGTAEYLSGLRAAAPVLVEVLHVSEGKGFADAFNAGIAHARGEFVVLLNNDTITTRYWLDQMVALAMSAPTIGIVGAMTNYAAGPQSVGAVPYRITTKVLSQNANVLRNGQPSIDIEPVERFAQKWRDQNRGQWFEADRLSLFCLLFKGEVLNLVTPLQAQSLFTFDSDVVYRKTRQSGYQLVCCRDLFIHCFASRPSDATGRATTNGTNP